MLIAVVICFPSCLPDKQEKEEVALDYDLKKEVFQKIYDYQDRHLTDSLKVFLNSDKAALRYASLRAFGSTRDSSHLNSVTPLLLEEDVQLASMAAYVIGQMGAASGKSHLINAFRSMDTMGKYNLLNSRILEAIGKCGDREALELIATIKTYIPTDTLLLEGQARGLYRFALRGMTHPEGTSTMVDYCTKRRYPYSVRLIAAHYLARSVEIDIRGFAYVLSRSLENEGDPYLRMALCLALAKTGSERGRQLLSELAINDPDYRVRANALRGLEIIGGTQLIPTAMNALRDPHSGVSLIAGNMLIRNLDEDRASHIHENATDTNLPIHTRAALYAAALKNMPFYYTVSASSINSSLRDLYNSTEDPFDQLLWITALSYDPVNLNFILSGFENHEHPYLRTNTLFQLENTLQIARNKPAVNFNRTTVTRLIANKLTNALQSEDSGLIAAASDVIRRQKEFLTPYFRDTTLFDSALENLSFPAQIEVHNNLVRTLNALFDLDRPYIEPEWNNPIDWELYNKLPDTVRVAMHFSEGVVRLALPKSTAPGTVANFVQLAIDGYYDDKHVHRVVTNFVVQDGCPRGDGYGSGDFTIRSELPPVYFEKEGLIGMASAGNHTESLQWFITHSPTLHLDGNYTQFGEVYSGMDIVHQLSIGAEVKKIELLHE
nr:peptidylprolyl isomerase [Saprospiraceae bacterium]